MIDKLLEKYDGAKELAEVRTLFGSTRMDWSNRKTSKRETKMQEECILV